MERRREFASVEDAFAALSTDIKEHSGRVEAYADLLFIEVCSADEYTLNMNSRVRLRYEHRDKMALAARYHDIGKVLVPADYYWFENDFTPEEGALYRRHCLAGENMVRRIMTAQKGHTPATIDTICEGISSHHENWDGTGFPNKYKWEDVPVIGRIVAIADELDHLLMNTRTETPVQTALDHMMADAGTRFDPALMGMMYEAKFKIDKIFALYRGESRAIPQTPRIIRRKSKRPMWLRYRPILDTRTKKVVAVESNMQFHRGKEDVGYAEAEKLLRQAKKLWEAQLCFVVEACDAAKRMKNCEVGGKFVALHTVQGFWKRKGAGSAVAKLLSDIDADPTALCFVLSGDEAASPTPNVVENCQKLREAGCYVMCNGVAPEALSAEVVQSLGVSHIRFHADQVGRIDKQLSKLKKLTDNGIVMVGEGVDKHRHAAALAAGNIHYVSGDLMGEYAAEDDFIAGELATAQ